MRLTRTATAAAAGALVLSAVGMGAAQAHESKGKGHGGGQSVVGLASEGTSLVQLKVRKGVQAGASAKVTGLQGDAKLVGIDHRVQDGKLYGVGDKGGVYTLDAGNGAATKVAQLTVGLQGTAFGVDFNPAANALRIISDTGQNLRHPFATPGAQTVADKTLNSPTATPPVDGTKGVTAAAYTNNDLADGTGTVLYDISTASDQLLIQSPANSGALVPVGGLGVDAQGDAGFDVLSELRDGRSVGSKAWASLTVGGKQGLYEVNLTNGSASKVGDLPAGVTDIAVPLAR
ncbi:DUF4394 domain-containing protein [Quadrisphaera setariae]|uniref:DUF4394 domain-containing protein n=1 Tax=Quadrisphaera setariae TaxID=2593304 RepID=A0A5C8ZF42_9ACTN|nr:DUF4394 domain-containing protein [Quadrisphaera setariae]TXR55798.1 DUF4394 domain-containing protein [Quadrisphaera setariae]